MIKEMIRKRRGYKQTVSTALMGIHILKKYPDEVEGYPSIPTCNMQRVIISNYLKCQIISMLVTIKKKNNTTIKYLSINKSAIKINLFVE